MTTLRVLVAEDDEDHRYLTVRALRRAGDVDIVEARDGEETLDRLFGRGAHVDAPLPHLVFLDLQMPKASGFDVLEQLRTDADRSAIPVVVVTSSALQEDVDTAYRLGSNSYVTKAANNALADHLLRVAEYWTAHNELPGLPAA